MSWKSWGSALLVLTLCAQAAPLRAQSAQRARAGVPLVLSFTLPTSRPQLSAGGLLVQTAGGLIGGLGAAAAVGIPLMLGTWDSGGPSEDTLAVLIGGAWGAGTVIGIHYVGRRQEMSANPWATTAGVLVGAVVGGATVHEDEEGYAVPTILTFVGPSLGGTAGFALTRRGR